MSSSHAYILTFRQRKSSGPTAPTAYRVTQEDNVLGDRARATLIRGGSASVRGRVGP